MENRDPRTCEHCGFIHINIGVCPRIKAIEYYEDGLTIRRVEYHSTTPIATANNVSGPAFPYGPAGSRAPTQ